MNSPEYRQTAFQRARAAYGLGRYQAAIAELTQLVAMHPEDANAHALLSLSQRAVGDIEGALASGETSVRLTPNHGYSLYAYAYALLAASRLPEARSAIEGALREQPQDADYWGALAEVELQDAHSDEGRRAALRGLEVNPQHMTCLLAQSRACLQLGRHDELAETAHRALAADPGSWRCHLNMAFSRFACRDYPAAVASCREALQLAPGEEQVRFWYRQMLAADTWIGRRLGFARIPRTITPEAAKQRESAVSRMARLMLTCVVVAAVMTPVLVWSLAACGFVPAAVLLRQGATSGWLATCLVPFGMYSAPLCLHPEGRRWWRRELPFLSLVVTWFAAWLAVFLVACAFTEYGWLWFQLLGLLPLIVVLYAPAPCDRYIRCCYVAAVALHVLFLAALLGAPTGYLVFPPGCLPVELGTSLALMSYALFCAAAPELEVRIPTQAEALLEIERQQAEAGGTSEQPPR